MIRTGKNLGVTKADNSLHSKKNSNNTKLVSAKQERKARFSLKSPAMHDANPVEDSVPATGKAGPVEVPEVESLSEDTDNLAGEVRFSSKFSRRVRRNERSHCETDTVLHEKAVDPQQDDPPGKKKLLHTAGYVKKVKPAKQQKSHGGIPNVGDASTNAHSNDGSVGVVRISSTGIAEKLQNCVLDYNTNVDVSYIKFLADMIEDKDSEPIVELNSASVYRGIPELVGQLNKLLGTEIMPADFVEPDGTPVTVSKDLEVDII